MLMTGDACPRNIIRSRSVARSQRMIRSWSGLAAARVRPSGEKATALVLPIGIPEDTASADRQSYSMMSGSMPPTASQRPSGEKATAQAKPR